jgi:threonine dehydratase
MLTRADIVAARARMGQAVRVSPCAYSQRLSEATGLSLYFKLESLQMTDSFKERRACNKLLLLGDEARQRGVIAASAGNHAQGVAYHARRLGVAATIVMPRSTALVKASSTRGYGARVVLHGAGYDDAEAEALRIAAEEGQIFVHAFDDEAVMAGQGTVGLELIEQVPDLHAVIVAVGGGGLSTAIALAVKEHDPSIQVFGVESSAMSSMAAALAAGRPTRVPTRTTLADGVAVGQVGAAPFAIAHLLDNVVSVDDEEVAEAILVLLEKEKIVAEGAGAAPLAALLGGKISPAGKNVALVVGGGNIDVNLLSRIIERGLAKSGRLMRLAVRLRDVPGALARLLDILAAHEANILEILHERGTTRLEFGETSVELVAETRDFDHIEAICSAVRDAGHEIAEG